MAHGWRSWAPSSSACAAVGVALDMALVWPLVGRGEELRLVSEALGAGGSTQGVVLAGVAGVGKSRLAREALAVAEGRGAMTEWAAVTTATATIPLAALAHLVPSAVASKTRFELMQATVEALAARAGQRGVVLGVDDAHLLDDASAAVVHHLVARGAAKVALTVRTGEPLSDAVVALWKDGAVTWVELQPLARAEVQALAEAVLGARVDGTTIERLWQCSQGNVLYLRELVLGGIDAGWLRLNDGLWRWDGALAPGPRLARLVATRFGRLRADERELLELLALGEPLELGVFTERASRATVIVGTAGLGGDRPRGRAAPCPAGPSALRRGAAGGDAEPASRGSLPVAGRRGGGPRSHRVRRYVGRGRLAPGVGGRW